MPRTYDDEIQQRILERKKRAEQAREEQIRKRNQIFMIGGIALVVLIVLIIIISKIASGFFENNCLHSGRYKVIIPSSKFQQRISRFAKERTFYENHCNRRLRGKPRRPELGSAGSLG